MRYKEFEFRNFKGIESMSLALSGDVTTLIGLNESGKSTILQAIYCFSYGAEDLAAINPELASLRHDPDRWIPIAQRANFNDDIQVTATVILDSAERADLRKYMKSNFDLNLAAAPTEIAITERYNFKDSHYSRKVNSWSLTISGTKPPQRKPRSYRANSKEWQGAVNYLKARLPKIYYFPNFLFELPDRFIMTESDGTGQEADRDRFYRTIFENIVSHTDDAATLDTHIIERLQSGDRNKRKSMQALLLKMSDAVSTTVFDGWNLIFGDAAPVAQAANIAAQLGPDDSVFLELQIKGADGVYDLSERSLGFRWFFMYLLMTSFRRDAGARSKPVILLDEPASNLHSRAQALLLESFTDLAKHCQLVYATHSHHLINIRWLDGAYVVKNTALGSPDDMTDYLDRRGGARTSISVTKYRKFVAENPSEISYVQPVLDVLDYRPSDLEPVPNVVMLEGKSDFFLIRYMVDVLGVDSDLKLVPGTGAGTLDTLIQLHIGWGKSFLILLDSDAEGLKQKARYEREFGPMVRDRCVLLADMCKDPAVIAAETLLSAKDIAEIVDAVYAPGVQRPAAKKALSHAVVELYGRRQAVPIEGPTMVPFGGDHAASEALEATSSE